MTTLEKQTKPEIGKDPFADGRQAQSLWESMVTFQELASLGTINEEDKEEMEEKMKRLNQLNDIYGEREDFRLLYSQSLRFYRDVKGLPQ